MGAVSYAVDELPLAFAASEVDLAPLSPLEQEGLAYGLTGLSAGSHPLAAYRAWMAERRILDSAGVNAAPVDARVRAAGLLVMHQAPPTAKGFHFLTLEDADGFVNVIVRPAVYAEYRAVIRSAAVLLVAGIIQREGVVTNLLAEHLHKLT